jgi:hypothetical protein
VILDYFHCVSMEVNSAGIQDRAGARAAQMRLFCRFDAITTVFADSDYSGKLFDINRRGFLEVWRLNEYVSAKAFGHAGYLLGGIRLPERIAASVDVAA